VTKKISHAAPESTTAAQNGGFKYSHVSDSRKNSGGMTKGLIANRAMLDYAIIRRATSSDTVPVQVL